MTSASELFYIRRSRFGREDSELRFGSSSSSSSSLDRNFHDHHHNHGRRRHHRQQQRRDFEDCNPVRRSPHARHLCHREHEPVRLDYVTSQSRTGHSSSTDNLQNRSSRPSYSHNDRLPGAVLLARERLVERLRGVSLSGSRQNSRVSSGISLDELANDDEIRQVDDAGDWGTETPTYWLAEGFSPDELANSNDSSTVTDLLSSSQESRIKRAPGLGPEEVKCLPQEVFSNEVKTRVAIAMAECSICLERFAEGDELVCLPCRHQFHSACLVPWVRICGDCPYCRTHIVLGKKGQ